MKTKVCVQIASSLLCSAEKAGISHFPSAVWIAAHIPIQHPAGMSQGSPGSPADLLCDEAPMEMPLSTLDRTSGRVLGRHSNSSLLHKFTDWLLRSLRHLLPKQRN